MECDVFDDLCGAQGCEGRAVGVLRGRSVGRSVVRRAVWFGREDGRVLDDVNFDKN